MNYEQIQFRADDIGFEKAADKSQYWVETFLFRINAVPRPIPEKKWFMEPWVIVLVGGILPFGSIFIEMYFIFTSFWAYKIYYVYGFMLLGEEKYLTIVDTFL